MACAGTMAASNVFKPISAQDLREILKKDREKRLELIKADYVEKEYRKFPSNIRDVKKKKEHFRAFLRGEIDFISKNTAGSDGGRSRNNFGTDVEEYREEYHRIIKQASKEAFLLLSGPVEKGDSELRRGQYVRLKRVFPGIGDKEGNLVQETEVKNKEELLRVVAEFINYHQDKTQMFIFFLGHGTPGGEIKFKEDIYLLQKFVTFIEDTVKALPNFTHLSVVLGQCYSHLYSCSLDTRPWLDVIHLTDPLKPETHNWRRIVNGTDEFSCPELEAVAQKASDDHGLQFHGYRPSVFFDGVDKKFVCVQCRGVLRDPVQSSCGHRYCRKCVDVLIQNIPLARCKACSEEGEEDASFKNEIFPDHAIRRELGRQQVKCDNEDCTWRGKFEDYCRDHENGCPWMSTQCECGEKMSQFKLDKHKQEKCKMRSIQCRYCKQAFVASENKIHNEFCPKFPIRCNLCTDLGRKLPREQILLHQATDCIRNRNLCPYGCELGDSNVEHHMETSAVAHLDFLRDKIDMLNTRANHTRENSQLSDQASEQISRIAAQLEVCERDAEHASKKLKDAERRSIERRQRSENDNVSADLERLRNTRQAVDNHADTLESMVAVLNREVEKVCITLERFAGERGLDAGELDTQGKKIKSVERTLALKDVSMAEHDLRLQALEKASYDGVLIWKIEDFARKRHDAVSGRITSIYSNAFYTGPHGYKMCCRLYLNGDGMGKGTHLSLFFVVMRGQYDALNRWPFQQKVTLYLLDLANKEHIADAFKPDPTSSSFKRPTSDMNIASGCPLFLPLSQLQKPGTAYIKDDTMFIKVVVDCKEL